MEISGSIVCVLLENAALCRSVEKALSKGASVNEVSRAVRASGWRRGLQMNTATAECFVFTVNETNLPEEQWIARELAR